MTRTHSRESLLLPIHLPSKKLKLKVEGCCVDDLSNNWTPSRVIIGFPFGIEHLWVVTRDAEFLVLFRLEWVHSFWLADHYGSDKQAQVSLPRHKKNIVLAEHDKFAKACPSPPMTIVNTVMVKGLLNRYVRIHIQTKYYDDLLCVMIIYVCMYVCMSVCLSVCLSVCMYVRMYVCMCVCMCVYVRRYVRMYGCMHACMYVCMR